MKYWLLLLAVVFSGPANAEWHEAQTDHFVIYADDKAKDVRKFAENLERYHAAMELITGRKIGTPSPSSRVTIFVVGGQKEIRKLAGTKSRTIAGFYVPRASGSTAFVQDVQLRGNQTSFSMIILLHEYAHHFLISSTRFSMPRWLSEGSAEFFASAKFGKDGSLSLGRPAVHRAGELNHARDVSLEELFDHELYERNRGKRYDSFYGQSWLLYHYLHFSDARKGQIAAYQKAVALGDPSIEAARKAFGDLEELDHDLDRYAKQRRLPGYTIQSDLLPTGQIDVRQLPAGEAEMMPLRIRSQRGVNREQAAEIVIEAREVAGRHPQDAGALTALAEAEYDAGNDAEAIAAAEKAIAIEPGRKNAYVQKGYALFRMAESAEDESAAYAAAMKPFSALNKLETDHPLPLIYYYRSHAQQGVEPPDNAKHALERAAQLAPFDKNLWFRVAMMQAMEGKIRIARQSLRPLANDPHGGGRADRAARLMRLLDEMEDGTPVNFAKLSNAVEGDRPDVEEGSDDDSEVRMSNSGA